MEELLDYFKKHIAISPVMEQRFRQIAVEKSLTKGEVVLADDSIKKKHIFVVAGCLRSFYSMENGKEYTMQFAIKNWWIGDYITLYTDQKSIVSVESLMSSRIVVMDKREVEQFYKEYPLLESFQRKNFEKRIAALQKRILSLLAMTATEKYEQFIRDYAEFEKVIPNYQIASYLGITPQSLSRVRRKKANK